MLPSRYTDFAPLFNRFVEEFLDADIGEHHRKVYLEAARKADENYERVCRMADRGEDYTDDLLRTFLPHGDCSYTRQTNAWLHIASALQGPIRKKFENAGWIDAGDWPKVAASILELVRAGVERPEEFPEACRKFAASPHTNGLQPTYISPILNALRPDLYSIANMKPRVVLGWLTGEKFSDRLADYPEFNRRLRRAVDELAGTLDLHAGEGIDRYQVFDFFTHWLVSVEKYQFTEGKGAREERSASDPNPAARSVREIMPQQDDRRTLLTLFGEAILCAADENNHNWHVSQQRERPHALRTARMSDSPGQISLTSGVLYVARVNAIGLIAYVAQSQLTDTARDFILKSGGKTRMWEPATYPEPIVYFAVSPDLVDWYRSEIQSLHFDLIRKTSQLRPNSPYKKYHDRNVVSVVREETGLAIPQPGYYDAVRPTHYWWLNCNPSVWELRSLGTGEEKSYTAFNENGNKRRIYRHMQELRPGDLVVGYETSPRKAVTAVLKITRPLTPTDDNEEFTFRKVLDVPRPVPFDAVQSLPSLASSEPVTNNQGSLFALSAEEFATVAELAGVDMEAIAESIDVGSDGGDLSRRVQNALNDPIAVNSAAARHEFEERARRMLHEKLGEMTSVDIREFLELLTIGRKDGDTVVKARFGMALTGSLAQMMAADPEAFNRWLELLWNSGPEDGPENFERFRRSGEVKGAGVSLPSIVLYLKDPETYGIAIGVMLRALKELGYDMPTKITTAQEYRRYLTALHSFRKAHDLDPSMMDYVLWKLMEDDGPGSGRGERGVDESYSLCHVAEETHIPESTLEQWISAIERKGQAILYGPPGTGKTFVAKKLARFLSLSGGGGLVQTIQFHPAYGYEDFIRGIRPRTDEETDELRYEYVSGAFMAFCEKAEQMGEETRCVMIIDEINRADLARVFGELMYLLEYREEKVRIAGGREFSIPLNVRIIGTMNTADRSIALVDHALRRRFAFLELKPDYELLARYHQKQKTGFEAAPLAEVLRRVNRAIGDPHYELGISWFLDPGIDDALPQIWQTEIEPYLVEHFFDQPQTMEAFRWEKVRVELGRKPTDVSSVEFQVTGEE